MSKFALANARRRKSINRKIKQISCVSIVLIAAFVLMMFGWNSVHKDTFAGSEVTKVSKGIVEELKQLPQYGKSASDRANNIGTESNPFVILEVVPNDTYAQIGYLIDGCQPIDVSKLTDHGDNGVIAKKLPDTLKASCDGYYFDSEGAPEGFSITNTSLITDELANDNLVKGYYELDSDGNATTKWHSLNEYTLKSETTEAVTFLKTATATTNPSIIDGKAYAVRKSTEADRVNKYTYYYYNLEVTDSFIYNSLDVAKDKVDDYCIVVKTIAAKDLKVNESGDDWIDYANLIDISANVYDSKLYSLRESYPSTSYSTTGTFSDSDTFNTSDLEFYAVKKIYDRVNYDTNPAAIMIDHEAYNTDNYSGKDVTSNVYDWNLKDTKKTVSLKGYDNNVYKLCCMLFSMNPNAYNNTVGSESNTEDWLSVSDSKDGLYEKNENDEKYWSMASFKLIPSLNYMYENYSTSVSVDDLKKYWSSKSAWNATGTVIPVQDKYYVSDKYMTYDGSSLLSKYVKERTDMWTDAYYSSYLTYAKRTVTLVETDENGEQHQYVGPEHDNIVKSFATGIRYVLHYSADVDSSFTSYSTFSGSLKVLDVEPSTKTVYNNDGSGPLKAKAVLKKSYIYMLLPYCKAKSDDISISHMTTAEFNGTNKDLNSEYSLIYLGIDDGAYNLVEKNVSLKKGTVSLNVPDWNDDDLENHIYTHTGDKLYSAESIGVNGESKSVKFINGVSEYPNGNNPELRFMGNDITCIKKLELISYAKAGLPIVCDDLLYNQEQSIVDKKSFIYTLISALKSDYKDVVCDGNGISASENKNVQKIIADVEKQEIVISEYPTIYNGETSSGATLKYGSESAGSSNYIYLPTTDNGERAYLHFKFTAPADGYAYTLYIDSNSNGKFEKDEAILDGLDAQNNIATDVTYKLRSDLVGNIQWKITVYKKSNTNIRTSLSGCSAVKKKPSANKKKINVLQISHGNSRCSSSTYLTESRYSTYYGDLDAYDVQVKVISWDSYKNMFSGFGAGGFAFDIGEDISDTNPRASKLSDAYNISVPGTSWKLSDVNMIIIGFGDSFGEKDMTNDYGELNYIQYYIASGGGILLTHDLTSMHNIWTRKVFGRMANMKLRDMMGMNVYGMVSNQLNDSEKADMVEYQENEYKTSLGLLDISQSEANSLGYSFNTKIYDKAGNVRTNVTQGFTYYAMKRLGFGENYNSSTSSPNVNSGWTSGFFKMPFANMIKLANDSNSSICNYSVSKNTGINNNNDTTTIATKQNEGQITQYPYKIDESLTISKTHAQWYSLNLEDPEVTVWYTLADDGKNKTAGSTYKYADASPTTYGVSPKDAANNYYIYSKDNIYYSGVGHTTLTEVSEIKLFVNTMIAAYRAGHEPPSVEIVSEEAVNTGGDNYTIEIMQTYSTQASSNGQNVQEAENLESDTQSIVFTPYQYDTSAKKLNVTISLTNIGNTVAAVPLNSSKLELNGNKVRVYECDRYGRNKGSQVGDDSSNTYSLKQGRYYLIEYPTKFLQCDVDGNRSSVNCLRKVKFEASNEKTTKTRITELTCTVDPLFELD